MNCGTAIWIYGSSARGDTDELSDFDVLVVGNMKSSLIEVVQTATPNTRPPAISNYSWRELIEMERYGSLFLHHLRLEGRPLIEEDLCRGSLRRMLQDLGPYTKATKDLSAFKVVLSDVERSLKIGDLLVFELSVLATVIRHASILGCWLIGVPCFGRTLPVLRFSGAAMKDSHGLDGFADLYAYRLYLDKRIRRRKLVGVCPFFWLHRAKALLGGLEEVIDGHSADVLERHC